MKQHAGARSLVFGGLMAALTLGLVYIVPVTVVYPLPLVLVYVRHGFRAMLTAGGAVALLCAALFGPVRALLLVPVIVLPAMAMGYGVSHRLSPAITVAATTVTAFVSVLLNLAMAFLVMGQNPIDLQIRAQQEALVYSRSLLERLSPPATNPQAAAMMEQMELMVELLPDLVMLLLPVLLLMGAALAAVLMYSVCRWVLPRLGHHVEPMLPFRQWQAPPWLSWVVLGGLLVMFLAGQAGADWLRRMAVNVVVAIVFVYLVIGMAVAYHWLQARMSKGIAVTLLVMVTLMVQNIAILALMLIGMFDGAFDFRKLRAQTQGGDRP